MVAGAMRHVVDVYKNSAPSLDSDGQQIPNSVVLRANVPCAIEILSGRELESARKQVAEATTRVSLYQSRSAPVTVGCWLRWEGQTAGSVRMDVLHVGDQSPFTDGLAATLLCVGEVLP